jgi:hypothetical protein
MSTVYEIKQAITKLAPEAYAELMSELMDFADDKWDAQMKTDAASGRLDFLDVQFERASREGLLQNLRKRLSLPTSSSNPSSKKCVPLAKKSFSNPLPEPVKIQLQNRPKRVLIPKAACFWILVEGHSASRLCAAV